MNSLRCFAVLCLGLCCGCSSLDLSKYKSLWPAGREKPQQPTSVVAIWSEGVAHHPGSPPIRGLAGRLIFYGGDGTKPVRVDGTLTVYAFDEAGRHKLDAKPNRKYVFTPEQLANHYDKIKVGPAYSVWIPWDEAGGATKDLSLIVRFSPKGGQLVVGEMARAVLIGTTPPVAEAMPPNRGAAPAVDGDTMVRRASYESPAPSRPGELPDAEQAGGGIRSTTILLPDDLTRQMGAARPAGVAQHNGCTTIVQGGVAASMAGAAGVYRQPARPAGAPPMPSAGIAMASAQNAGPARASDPATRAGFPPSPPTGRSEARWPLARPRVPGVIVAPLTRDHAASRPGPATPRYPPEPTPPPGPLPAGATPSSSAPPPGN